MVKKIISGGQTGADRAGLNVAIERGMPHGGWAPQGFKAEDERVPSFYGLKEYPVPGYPPRTEQNVLDSDGTVIFAFGSLAGGSALTRKLAVRHDRSYLAINLNLDLETNVEKLVEWLQKEKIRVLNVAGSRQGSQRQRSGHASRKILASALDLMHRLDQEDQTDSQDQIAD